MKTLASLLAVCTVGYSCTTLPISETLTSNLDQEEDSCLELKDLYAHHCPPSYQRTSFCRYLQKKITFLEEEREGVEECFCSRECQENRY